MLKPIILCVLLTISLSHLIHPGQIPHILEKKAKNPRHVLAEKVQPTSATSTANPVQGIQNATSGYLSVNDPASASKLFYVFYSCRNLTSGQVPKDVPIIVWLQGGPGASSFMGGLMEFGPYRIEKDATSGKSKEVRNDYSWNDHYNLLIVDNPRGTGYSVADNESYLTTQDEVAEDFLNVLLNFYQLDAFSIYAQTPLYIFSESYGGHYAPSISKRLIEYNRGSPAQKIPFAGMSIGDGWTDPIHQLSGYDTFAYSLGFVDYNEKKEIARSQLLGIGNILKGAFADAGNNFGDILTLIHNSTGGIDVYNFRLFGTWSGDILDPFFNDPENAARYNVDASRIGTYQSLNMDVYGGFKDDFMKSYADRVAFVAESGLPVLLYNGQYDIIVNTPSALNWIGQLVWSGQLGFYNAPLQNWKYNNGSTVGWAKNYKNLTFAVMNKAGHFAPTDQIETSIELVRRFISGNHKWNQTFTA